LPKADYYALGHLHIDFQHENFVYPGPTFPNNFQELEDLQNGSFYIVDTLKSQNSLEKIELKIKEVVSVEISVRNALVATQQIISELEKRDLNDKIILLRIRGEIENGKSSDIKFSQVEEFAKSKGAFFLLRNTHDLKSKEFEIEIDTSNTENIEEETIKKFSEQSPSDLNLLIPQIMNAFSLEKKEDEKTEIFNNRVIAEAQKILRF